MNLTTTYDKSHLPAAEASRKASADADATLETAYQCLTAATERLSTVVGKLRSGFSESQERDQGYGTRRGGVAHLPTLAHCVP